MLSPPDVDRVADVGEEPVQHGRALRAGSAAIHDRAPRNDGGEQHGQIRGAQVIGGEQTSTGGREMLESLDLDLRHGAQRERTRRRAGRAGSFVGSRIVERRMRQRARVG